jgi:hypothetical protein
MTDSEGKRQPLLTTRPATVTFTVDMGENARRDYGADPSGDGLDISSSHHEKAPGQHEIYLREDSAWPLPTKLPHLNLWCAQWRSATPLLPRSCQNRSTA